MKTLTRTLAIAAVATAGLWTSQASAALIANESYNGDTYLGVHNPLTNDTSLFNDATLVSGFFTHTWFFDIAPSAATTVNANFIPGFPDPLSITGFTVSLFDVTAATCGAIGDSCTGITLGGLIGTGTPGTNSSNIGFTQLDAGRYAFQVSGTVVSEPTLYSGQLVTKVPEPGTIGLLGLALLGIAFAGRRSRKSPLA